MKEQYRIMGVPFDPVTVKTGAKHIFGLIERGEKGRYIVTPNPEIVMMAQQDVQLKGIISGAEMSVPDGIGIVLASKILRGPIHNRAAGYDLVQELFSLMAENQRTAYFLGGAPGVPEAAADAMEKKYAGLTVVGTHDGYFQQDEDAVIVQEINKLAPDLLLVGLGAPKQEKWMQGHCHLLDVGVMIGVGGSFDVMSGKSKRAPFWMQKCGLEWLYRVAKEPFRIKRIWRLPLFLIMVVKSKFV